MRARTSRNRSLSIRQGSNRRWGESPQLSWTDFGPLQVPPVRPEPADPDPQHAIRAPHTRCGVGSEGDLELVAEDEILQRNVTPGAEGSKDAAEEEEYQLKHPAA
jgi:hypothetical protein